LLLCENPSVDHLTDLPLERRQAFLLDMALLGEAVERACHPRRINDAVRAEHAYATRSTASSARRSAASSSV
jgi:diadenosine tetraphosphate (Ap4A) HIT family hydrolase